MADNTVKCDKCDREFVSELRDRFSDCVEHYDLKFAPHYTVYVRISKNEEQKPLIH